MPIFKKRLEGYCRFQGLKKNMNINSSLILSVFVLFGAISWAAACPTSCYCDVAMVNCSSRGLTSVPANIPLNTTELYLDHNQLTSIDGNDLSYLPVLVEIDLSHNQISSMLAGAFANLDKLQNLFVNNNNLTTLPAAIFDNVTALTKAVFSYNSLSSLPAGIFVNNLNLVSLDLSYNRLDEAVFDKISHLFLLGQLDLSGNPIHLLPYLMLEHAQSLDTLVLKDAMFSYIDTNSLLGMDSLQFLFLQNNHIEHLKREIFQPITSQIASLDVSGNSLICDCDMKKFQDWLHDSSVTFVATTCFDSVLNTNIDIETGNLSHLCTDLDLPLSTPPPTCIPDEETCQENAILVLSASDIDQSSVVISWQYSDVIDDAILDIKCRLHLGVEIFQTQVETSDKSFIVTGLQKGSAYSCCGLVLTCDLYSCVDFVSEGLEPCSHTEFIIALSVLTVVLIFAIAVIIFLLILKIKQDPKLRSGTQEDIAKSTPHWDTSQSSLVSVNNNNRITMVSMNSHLSLDSNVGRPLPQVKRESLYEHIPDPDPSTPVVPSPMIVNPLPGVTNKGFLESDCSASDLSSELSTKSERTSPHKYKQNTPNGNKKRFQTQKSDDNMAVRGNSNSIPDGTVSSQYLTPFEQQSGAKKLRRFVRDPQKQSNPVSSAQSEPDMSQNSPYPVEHARHSDPSHVIAPPRTHSRSDGDIAREHNVVVRFDTNPNNFSGQANHEKGHVSQTISQDNVPYLPPKHTNLGSSVI